jgi:hypothetical protein
VHITHQPVAHQPITPTPERSPADGIDPLLTLPSTFVAFHTLRREPYLRYACLRLDIAEADRAVRETFGDLAVTWPQVLCSANPSAHAWSLLKHRVRHRTRRPWPRRRTHPTAAVASRLPETREDIRLLDHIGCSPQQITDLTGLPADTVRSLLAVPRRGRTTTADDTRATFDLPKECATAVRAVGRRLPGHDRPGAYAACNGASFH